MSSEKRSYVNKKREHPWVAPKNAGKLIVQVYVVEPWRIV